MIKDLFKYIKTKKNKKKLYIILVFIIINIIATLFFTYSLYLLKGIEDLIRSFIIVVMYIIGFVFLIKGLKLVTKTKTKKLVIYIILITLSIAIQSFLGYKIRTIYDPISTINKNQILYTTKLITLKENKINDINDLKNKKIGIISKEKGKEDNTIGNLIISENNLKKNNTIKEYDDYFNIINDLYDKKLDAVFVSDNYSIMFNTYEKFENIDEKVISITSKSKTFKKTNTSINTKKVSKEPFAILLMGVDSEKDGLDKNAAFNGDSIMLITFNPKTLTATTLSIPRDTYVPIMCFKNQKRNKITHASWYGADCMIKTIENFTDIDIDYYVKMNFKGVVNLVDALGGVDLDVPMKFCEQNSDRQFGNKQICLKSGYQHLNGEQALALARHRKTLTNGDIGRGLNQQLVIQAMTKKISSVNTVTKFNDILNSVTKNMDTNLSTEQILSFYNIAKDILLKGNNSNDELVNIQKLFLNGYGQMIYDESFKLNLYEYIYYKNSLTEVVDAMKENLNIKEPTLIKDFSFDVNVIYEEKVIGQSEKDSTKILTLANLIGKDKNYVISYCNKNSITYSFITIDKDNPLYNSKYDNNEIIKQSISSGTELSKVRSIVFSVIKKEESVSIIPKKEEKQEEAISNNNEKEKKEEEDNNSNVTNEDSLNNDDIEEEDAGPTEEPINEEEN